MKKYTIIIALLFSFNFIRSQTSVDSSDFVAFFNANLGYQFPKYDMETWFGQNANVGGGFSIKTTSNWTFEIGFNYLWGNTIKNKDSVLYSILTSEKNIIDGNGQYGIINYSEAGWSTMFTIGKIIPISKKYQNSGLWIKAGFGLLQHKILIESQDNLIPQIKDDYRKGYDKLSNGFSASQFIGYVWLSKRGVKNAFAGFEFVEGWTKSRRDVDFNTGLPDTKAKFDLLMGVKIGWIISVYKRKPDAFYFN